MPKFAVCTSRFSPSLIHSLCAIFASNSRFRRPFRTALDTCLNSPLLVSLSVHGLHFTVYALSSNVAEICKMFCFAGHSDLGVHRRKLRTTTVGRNDHGTLPSWLSLFAREHAKDFTL